MIHATQKPKRENKVKKEEEVKPEFEDQKPEFSWNYGDRKLGFDGKDGKRKFEDEGLAWDSVLPDSTAEHPTGTLAG